MQKENRREYFRIDDRAIIACRVLSPRNFHQERNNILEGKTLQQNPHFASIANQIEALSEEIKGENLKIGRCLNLINEQLNMLVQQHLHEQLEQFSDIKPKSVNLSAGGIGFKVTHPIEPGQCLLMELCLLPNYEYMRTIVTIRSCRENEGIFFIGTEFTVIHDHDKEILIQYVYQKDASRLGSRSA